MCIMNSMIPDGTNMRTIGRTAWEQDTLWLVHSGSGAEFVCTASKIAVTILADTGREHGEGNRARVAIYVDGNCVVDSMVEKEQETYTVLEQEEEKECVVRVIKLSEAAMSTIGIKSIEVTAGGTVFPTKEKERFIEFVGDSITCGYGTDDEDPNHGFQTATENVTKTYAYKTATALDADYSMVSFSGYGIISGYTEDGLEPLKTQLVPEYYEKLGFSNGIYLGRKPVDVAWEFFRRQPELIVVNLGTNDDSYTLDYTDRQEMFRAEYVEFLKTIRRNNPEAVLLCTLGIMRDRLCPYVEQAVEQYRKETGEKRIFSMRFDLQREEDGLAADWHPTEATHARAAAKLTNKIKEIMGW